MKTTSTLSISALLVVLWQSTASAQVSVELYDYLVQDVCQNSSGSAVAGDPATCANRRNIGIYEPSPYILTDYDTVHNTSYSAWASIPVLGEDGNTRVLVTKNLDGNFNQNFQFSFNQADDGFDLIDVSFSSYASFIRTSDGGCLDQVFAPALNRGTMLGRRFPQVRAGGWVLFPLSTSPSSWAQSNAISNTTAKIQLSSAPGCSNGSSMGRTYWNSPANYTFETGKNLQAIRSDHFASTNLASSGNALERFYFTTEYGLTRWEAWVPRSRCQADAAQKQPGELRPHCEPDIRPPNPYTGPNQGAPEVDLRARCSVMNVSATAHPDIDTWGNQDWVRVDCRDQTRYLQLATPRLMLNAAVAQGNGVDDIDY